jgi:RimJ/RimL family protein N-acetyltransferase
MENARSLRLHRVRLDVDAENEVARRLYHRAGFTSIYEGRAPRLGLHMHSMALTL